MNHLSYLPSHPVALTLATFPETADSQGVDGRACAAASIFGLTPGHTYAVWHGYVAGQEGWGAGPIEDFGPAHSLVAESNGRGVVSIRLQGMNVPAGSFVWVIVFDHGPASLADSRFRTDDVVFPHGTVFRAPSFEMAADEVGVH